MSEQINTPPVQPSEAERPWTRLSVNLNDEAAIAFKGIADRRGLSYTETARRAIALMAALENANRIFEERPGGRTVEIILM